MSAKTSGLFLILLLLLLPLSCTAPDDQEPAGAPVDDAPPEQAEMLNPGDKIGEMEITTAEAWDWDNNLYSLCIEGNAANEALDADESVKNREYPCDLYAGAELIFTCAGVDAQPDDSLDERWARLETEMVFDGRAINLPAFGSLENTYGGQTIRLWNVLLRNITPGEHTLWCRSTFDGETGEGTFKFFVSEPPKLEAPENAQELVFQGKSALFYTLADFFTLLETAVAEDDMGHFWAALDIVGQSPLIFGDYAVFPYKGDGRTVVWQGLYFSKPYTRLGESKIWLMMQQFEPDAVLEYRIEVDGEEQMDPMNPLRIEAFSNTSLLQMPAFEVPEETLYREDIPHGDLTDNLLISSAHLGYDKFYRVYTPPGYEGLESLPTIYVSDGTDGINEVYLAMVNVLDNLIADGRIQPVIAVFIDPHNAATGEYVREVELDPIDMQTCPFCDFVAEELVPLIDANYKTDPSPDARALLGTSLGGRWASYMALTHNDLFHLIGIQSHPLEPNHWLWEAYEKVNELPLKVFLHHGTYDIGTAPQLAELLEQKAVPLRYIENHGGHGYSSWRTTTDEALEFFFPP